MKKVSAQTLVLHAIRVGRTVSGLRVGLHAASACYFLVLAVFPALLLVLSALRYTHLEVEQLAELLQGILPQAFLEPARKLILSAYRNSSGAAVGVSALVTLWSASRGTFGFMNGLNAVYGVRENRGYVYRRVISVLYTFAFIVVLVLTLGLHVFGASLARLIQRMAPAIYSFFADVINLRFFLLLFVQTVIFTGMFMRLPNRKNTLMESLPGALMAASGWLIFSDLYSIYVERFARLSNVYGSVYAVALSMLWLYCCISIVFYGGALNRLLAGWNRTNSEGKQSSER